MTAPINAIILVGDATVGKTHLISRYVRGILPKCPQSTIGVEFSTRTVPLQIGGTVKAQIWDTAGQERYRSITTAHYRRAVGAIIVYDITRRSTFANVSKWLDDLRENGEKDIVVMLVGNKVDLIDQDATRRQIPYATGVLYAQSNGLFFSETSAVTSYNVKHIFEHLLQEIYNQRTKGKCDITEDITQSNRPIKLLAPTSFNNDKWDAQKQESNKFSTSLASFFDCCSLQ